ncbi:MAG: YfcE family phosphodiesterase [Patescibacteria group bacterium]|jgi:hypothetical protein|nr:YfcE family phosphodiesterase [Patescibacteria group bacterium]MDD5173155.1 YfcE family phosphodiesterase [Patescibacteria group bacterium]
MHIAIISDSHDNIPNLKKFFDYCQKEKIDTIIHCGDLCKINCVIESWPKNFEAKIHFVYGNADILEELNNKIFSNLKIYGQIGEIFLENKRMAFTHFPGQAKKLGETQKYDYVFYGHDHKPWEETLKKTALVNPGNLAGIFYKASFALLDLEKNELSLKILEEI